MLIWRFEMSSDSKSLLQPRIVHLIISGTEKRTIGRISSKKYGCLFSLSFKKSCSHFSIFTLLFFYKNNNILPDISKLKEKKHLNQKRNSTASIWLKKCLKRQIKLKKMTTAINSIESHSGTSRLPSFKSWAIRLGWKPCLAWPHFFFLTGRESILDAEQPEMGLRRDQTWHLILWKWVEWVKNVNGCLGLNIFQR